MNKSHKPSAVLARAVFEHHEALLIGNDDDAMEAVIVKAVALIAIAFGVSPTDTDEEFRILDTDEALSKLRVALAVIAVKEGKVDAEKNASPAISRGNGTRNSTPND